MGTHKEFIKSRIYLAGLVTRALFPNSNFIVGISSEHFTLINASTSVKGMENLYNAVRVSLKKLSENAKNSAKVEV